MCTTTAQPGNEILAPSGISRSPRVTSKGFLKLVAPRDREYGNSDEMKSASHVSRAIFPRMDKIISVTRSTLFTFECDRLDLFHSAGATLINERAFNFES